MYRTALLMYVGSIFRNFRGRHGSWRLVHHHRVGKVTTTEVWVWLGVSFRNLSMETILS